MRGKVICKGENPTHIGHWLISGSLFQHTARLLVFPGNIQKKTHWCLMLDERVTISCMIISIHDADKIRANIFAFAVIKNHRILKIIKYSSVIIIPF